MKTLKILKKLIRQSSKNNDTNNSNKAGQFAEEMRQKYYGEFAGKN